LTGASLVKDLRKLGIELWADGDRLRYRAPKGTLTEVLRRAIAEHKSEVLALLTNPNGFVERPALPELEVEEGKRHEAFALNEIQQAYWLGRGGFFEMGNVAAHVYGEVDGSDLDIGRLGWAWQRLIERHDMLRAVVLAEGRQQILRETPAYEIGVDDLTELDEATAERTRQEIRSRMSHQVREADQWPLFEIRASRRNGSTRLHISMDLLIADAWSILQLMREWEQVYRNPEVELPRLALSFRDYVETELKLEGSALRAQSAGYWQRRIATLAGAPELPLAMSPAAIQRPRFVRRSGRLEAEQWRQLKKRAQQAGVTPSMLLCTAFAEVLGSWSKTQRFTINVTMFNRLPLHEQVHQIVGDFTSVNLLEVNRTAGSFQQQAERLQRQLWEDLEHRYWSGLQVMRELHRMKGDGAMAAMPVVFTSALVQTAATEQPVVGWLGRLVYGISQTPQVWLDHQIYEDAGALVYNWDAVEQLFAEELLDAMFRAYADLLGRLMQEPAWQSESRMLAPLEQLDERRAVNVTEAEVADRRLEQLFQEQVQRQGGKDAVIAGELHLSYAELQARAEQVAQWLMERGARPNRLVAVVMEKGWEQVVAVLGVLQSGGAYLPIDAAVPAERLQYLLGHGEVELVLTQSGVLERFAWPQGLQCLAVDLVGRAAGVSPHAVDNTNRSQTDLAYVIYTSGSTGQPKGVMIDHRAAVNTILDMNRRFGITATDCVLAVSSLSFDLSVYDIFGTLAAGGTILPHAAAGPDPALWVEQMRRHGVTLWNSVPALMEMLVDYVEAHPANCPAALRQVWLSGDWIPLSLPDRIRRLWRHSDIISLGGATEAAIWSIYYRIGSIDPRWTSIPYGRPLANQRWHVLNEIGEPCPVWVTGHLYIAGLGLAQGYWRDPARTAAGFRTDPQTGERLYWTGDLGRYLPDGNIEFLGREDSQVKVQGHRIELGEVEAALDQHPNVRTSVVTVLGDSHASKRLVGYIVPSSPDSAPDPAALRLHLESKLPDYMIPALFVTLSSLPLSSNGKVDRRALPAPEPIRKSQDAVLPRDETEVRVARVWEEVLDIRPIAVMDDFFDVGGDSVTAVRLALRLQKEFNRELPVEAVFRATTVERISNLIRDTADRTPTPLVAIHGEGTRPPVFCIHPIGGSVGCYVELARALGDGQPFYGFQSIGGYSSIKSMAARYIEEILKVQPEGPYVLAGASMGGMVAYEMAQQLYRRGEEIALLALFDASPDWNGIGFPDETDRLEMLRRFTVELTSILGRGSLACDPGSFEELSEMFCGDIPRSQLRSQFRTFSANMSALRTYTPMRYPGRVVVFQAQANAHGSDRQSPGWHHLAEGGVDVHIVPGDHYTMLRRPHVDILAERLTAYLDNSSRGAAEMMMP
jgi:amino acid adenylation domain-containing protein